ncbi:unnamed protein product [Amoebophrya sp. A120]|nr:unnamed protein product [Amoebophrya sp. A120]|eukprot:GSA120T00000924001.1
MGKKGKNCSRALALAVASSPSATGGAGVRGVAGKKFLERRDGGSLASDINKLIGWEVFAEDKPGRQDAQTTEGGGQSALQQGSNEVTDSSAPLENAQHLPEDSSPGGHAEGGGTTEVEQPERAGSGTDVLPPGPAVAVPSHQHASFLDENEEKRQPTPPSPTQELDAVTTADFSQARSEVANSDSSTNTQHEEMKPQPGHTETAAEVDEHPARSNGSVSVRREPVDSAQHTSFLHENIGEQTSTQSFPAQHHGAVSRQDSDSSKISGSDSSPIVGQEAAKPATEHAGDICKCCKTSNRVCDADICNADYADLRIPHDT